MFSKILLIALGIAGIFISKDQYDQTECVRGELIPVETKVVSTYQNPHTYVETQEEEYVVNGETYTYTRPVSDADLQVLYCPEHPGNAFTENDIERAPILLYVSVALTVVLFVGALMSK